MTKAEIIDAAKATCPGATKADIECGMNLIFEVISNALARGEKVVVPHFGIFEVRDVAARQGRNPQTGELVTIPASKRVGFRASSTLKNLVK